jgi:hypothetical protein
MSDTNAVCPRTNSLPLAGCLWRDGLLEPDRSDRSHGDVGRGASGPELPSATDGAVVRAADSSCGPKPVAPRTGDVRPTCPAAPVSCGAREDIGPGTLEGCSQAPQAERGRHSRRTPAREASRNGVSLRTPSRRPRRLAACIADSSAAASIGAHTQSSGAPRKLLLASTAWEDSDQRCFAFIGGGQGRTCRALRTGFDAGPQTMNR